MTAKDAKNSLTKFTYLLGQCVKKKKINLDHMTFEIMSKFIINAIKFSLIDELRSLFQNYAVFWYSKTDLMSPPKYSQFARH